MWRLLQARFWIAACRQPSGIIVLIVLITLGCSRQPETVRCAVVQGNHAALERLLKDGADPNMAACGTPPLVTAIAYRDMEAVLILLRYGADINVSTPDGLTPLMQACISSREAIAWLLMERGADVSSLTSSNQNVLDFAMERASLSVELKWALFAAGARCMDWEAMAIRLIGLGHLEDLKLLIELAGDKAIDFKSPVRVGNFTIYPIQLAVTSCCPAMVDFILSKGVDPDATTEKGGTALLMAVGRRFPRMVESLLAAGADPTIEAPTRVSALSLADVTSPEIKELLNQWKREKAQEAQGTP